MRFESNNSSNFTVVPKLGTIAWGMWNILYHVGSIRILSCIVMIRIVILDNRRARNMFELSQRSFCVLRRSARQSWVNHDDIDFSGKKIRVVLMWAYLCLRIYLSLRTSPHDSYTFSKQLTFKFLMHNKFLNQWTFEFFTSSNKLY